MRSTNLSTIKPIWFSGALLLLMSFSLLGASTDPTGSFYDAKIRINPECKILRMSNGDILVTARNQEGTEVKHKFTDFYADLLLAAYRKQRLENIVNTLGKKYYLTEDECRRELKHAIHVLAEWNILIREEKIAMH